MAHDCFISYSHHDKPEADAVCATLEAKGIRCWIAPRDVVPGKDWGEAIVDAIQSSRVLVLVFSQHANDSQQIRREVQLAVEATIVLIPFRIENVDPTKALKYCLVTPHWLDALTPPLEAHLEHLAVAVNSFLAVGEPLDTTTAPESRPQPPVEAAAREEASRSRDVEYDVFLSYGYRDKPVAIGVQKGLHEIGRRRGQLRALRVFRDDVNVDANPDLWGKIIEALDGSRFMIVVLSPQAATSRWVNMEVNHWLERRGREGLMMVLVEGQLRWDEKTERFDPELSDAAPAPLTMPGSLPFEPLYIDVSSDAPWDHRAPAFREKVTALAAPIHAKPKSQLAGDDRHGQRRFWPFR